MNRPRLSRVMIVLSPVVLAMVVFCAWVLLGEPWVFSNNTDLDLHSGALRDQMFVFGVPVKSRVYESELSREIRRLGIAVPATRTWKRIGQANLVQRHSISSGYSRVLVRCDALLNTLGEVRAPDDERRVILQRLVTILQTQDPRSAGSQVRLRRDEVASQRGLRVLRPEFEEKLKTRRNQEQPQASVP
ncbi:MAG: hypothetical protein FJ280_01550 [Planctomycetes bacterium]|nr:hypothetical protein [Planctomycetota bacterium]